MSQKEITGTSSVLIAAGSETTATLLSGVTYLLLKNPEKYAKVKDEVRSAFSSAEEMTLLSTSKLQYLQACLEEALRVYPPVPGMLSRRTSPEGAIIDGVPVPPDVSPHRAACSQSSHIILTAHFQTVIAVTQFAAFHSSNNFTDPEAFVPERWLPNPPQKYKGDNRDALQAFSTGPRNCIGKKYVQISSTHFCIFIKFSQT
jgi:cytochrome P450